MRAKRVKFFKKDKGNGIIAPATAQVLFILQELEEMSRQMTAQDYG